MKNLLVTVGLVVIVCVAGAVLTQPSDDVRPCREDAQKFCKDVKPGKGRMFDCLKDHESEVSAPCKNHLDAMTEKRREKRNERKGAFKNACEGDVNKYCKDEGRRRIIPCLRDHESELSDACREFIKKK